MASIDLGLWFSVGRSTGSWKAGPRRGYGSAGGQSLSAPLDSAIVARMITA